MLPAPFSDPAPELRTYRVVCVLVAVMLPAFGYGFHWRDPSVVDPIWMRWALGVLPLLVAAGTYTSAWVRDHLSQLGLALIYVLITWSVAITASNDLAPEYALGHLLAVVMIGVATPDTVPLRATAGVLIWTALATALAVFWVQTPSTDPWTVCFCVATAALALFIGAWLRTEMQSRLRASELRYRTVFDTTADGFFLVDAASHQYLYANPSYLALTGYALDELRMLTLHDVTAIPPGLLAERSRDPFRTGRISLGEQQHRCKNGASVDLDLSINTIEHDGRTVFCAIAHDLTEQKRVRAEIEAARARAEEMLRTKSTLLDTMSHELRTPLASILGFAELLTEEVEDEQRELMEALHRNARRLNDTLGALLDLAQLRGGEAKIELEVVDVGEAAREVADLFQHRVEGRGLAFHVHVAPAARAQLDREALRRLLSHLLSNATKFTEEGEIHLTVEANDRRVFIRVTDTGIGMHEDDVPALFNAFEQASTGLYRVYEGTGLGLSVTKQLIDLMGGQIEVQSTLGVGTTFTVSFARTWASLETTLDPLTPSPSGPPAHTPRLAD